MYFTNLFCLAIAFTCAIAASVQYDDLGKPVDKRINWQADKRILGGKNADEGQFPHQVSLRSRFMKQHFCGGSVLSSRYILTAAHCTQGGNASPNNIFAVVGTINRVSGGINFDLKRITNHPSYNPSIFKNDISIIQTVQEIEFSDVVQPIALPTENLPEDEEYLLDLSGWGRTSYPQNSALPKTLQFIQTKYLNLAKCRKGFGNLPVIKNIHDSVVCTTSPATKGACMGDSGGPLISAGEPKVLVGVVSWGIPCGKGFPDVFTRVYSHVEWIQSEMERGA